MLRHNNFKSIVPPHFRPGDTITYNELLGNTIGSNCLSNTGINICKQYSDLVYNFFFSDLNLRHTKLMFSGLGNSGVVI